MTTRTSNTLAAVGAAIAMASVYGQEPRALDLSKMKGSPVAYEAQPMTNTLVLYPATNYISYANIAYAIMDSTCVTNAVGLRSVLSVDEVVMELREQGDMTNLVKKLVASGDVCAVIGHRWEPGCGNLACAVYHADPIRHCALCGKTQTQQPGEWK
jgi:hypothetical protein